MGMMSGTSADGIDAAGIAITGKGLSMRVRFLWLLHYPFRPALRRRVLAAMAPAETTTQEIARLDADLGDAFAEAAVQALEETDRKQRPTLIGLAGQTVCHLPSRQTGRSATLQLGQAARVAARTHLTTVSEFRQSDVAVGGQGAPLVPWTDFVLFKNQRVGRAVQNIGGIGNVTWIPAGASAEDVIAFDTGPGNMIIDALIARITNRRQCMDSNGHRAARGRILNDLLNEWMKLPYFRKKPPKSTGRETFGCEFVERELKRLRKASSSHDDWIATATAFTARSIAESYRRFIPDFCSTKSKSSKHAEPKSSPANYPLQSDKEVILCGGGALNPTLMAMLSACLPGVRIKTIQAMGIPAQAKEALSFAMLAAACVDGQPANLPQATGAARYAVLGQMVSI